MPLSTSGHIPWSEMDTRGRAMKMWASITKVSENDDGTLTVSGVASSEAVDSDGEVITSQAMRDAIPDYMKFGALREMHQPIAAGTAMQCEVQEDGKTYLEALVVDSESVKKVKTGVLKGFSIGGKVEKRNPKNKKIIEAIKLVEISLVDRPANPEAIIGLVKLEDTMDPETKPENKPTPDAEKATALGNLKKWAGEEVWDTQTALSALDALTYLLNKESQEPGEPAEQVQALLDAIAGVKRFIVSEIQEDSTGMAGGADDLEMGAATEGLEKKGATFSGSVKQKLGAIHKMIQDCDGAMKALGYDAEPDEDDAGKAATAEALAKAAGLEDELAKSNGERDEALQKAATLEKDLTATKAELAKAKTELAKKPLKVVPIDKTDDTSTKAAVAEAAPTDPLSAMKAVHASGGRLITVNRLGASQA